MKTNDIKRKIRDLIIIFTTYILAITLYILIYLLLKGNIFLSILIADVAATILVYLISIVFNNSTIYDPYWSVFPPIILLTLMIDKKLFEVNTIIYFTLITLWSIRLTFNWIITFTSLKHQDWRYDLFKNKYKKLWQFINFFGIQLFPTLIVYTALLAGIKLTLINKEFSSLTLIGFTTIFIGIFLEFTADRSMHNFLKINKSKFLVNDTGIWKYSRHPNYLGECLIWIGTFLALIVLDIKLYYYGIGFILMLALFLFISIPLMEKRQMSRRPNYENYQKTVSKFLILPNKYVKQDYPNLLNDFKNRELNDIILSMTEYMKEYPDCGYTKKHINLCTRILDKYIISLIKLSKTHTNDRIIKCVKKVVIRLNKLNEKTGGCLIETDQREYLALYIQNAAIAAGLTNIEDIGDITEEWREW